MKLILAGFVGAILMLLIPGLIVLMIVGLNLLIPAIARASGIEEMWIVIIFLVTSTGAGLGIALYGERKKPHKSKNEYEPYE